MPVYIGWGAAGVETRAASAVDIALWDLFAKAHGRPVADMLGGRARSAICTYNTCAGASYIGAICAADSRRRQQGQAAPPSAAMRTWTPS